LMIGMFWGRRRGKEVSHGNKGRKIEKKGARFLSDFVK
jgi:hypothetical protein